MEQEEIKVNVACGDKRLEGFVHIDTEMPVWVLDPLQASDLYKFIQHDVTEGMPFEDSTVSYIVAHHFLEHLTYPEGLLFLLECERVLKPGGVLSLVCPDFGYIAEKFGENPAHLRRLGELLLYPHEQGRIEWHKAAYDDNLLIAQATFVGLEAERKAVADTPYLEYDHDWQVCVRCTKPEVTS